MAEMVVSAVVQEAVTRVVSFVFGKQDEEMASQGHIRERLQMAAGELEFALERSAKLPITDVSLLDCRQTIKRVYVEATELLDKHKQQALQGQEELGQGMKRKLWMVRSKDTSVSSFPGLSMDDVRRFERFADCAGKFVRDVESGCSLWHHTFCNPLVRHLLEGKTVEYSMEQGNRLRHFFIWPMCSEERGVEANLGYCYKDNTVAEKCFYMQLILRLAESTDIARVAITCLQLLTSQFKLETESAIGELTLLSNLQDVSHSYELPWVGIQESHIKQSALCRPDPSCCKASRIGLCADNNIPLSVLSHKFPEQVILFYFKFYISALEYSLCSSSHEEGPSVSRGWRAPLEVELGILPHYDSGNEELYCYALETIRSNKGKWEVGMQQVAEMVRSNTTNCFFRQLEPTDYRMDWCSRHGSEFFIVEKPSLEKPGAPKTRRRYNTRASTKRRR